jgi:putative nucleotidyltransferase with HDIG domain
MAEHILVVQGEAVVRDTVARILTREGFRVHVAGDVDEAMLLCEKQPEISMVVSEARQEENFAMLRRVREANPGVRSIVIAPSQAASLPLPAQELGIEGWLPKPFDMDELLATVTRLSQSLKAERERVALLERLRQNVVTMVDSLAQALEARDPYTHGHSLRVAEYSLLIAEELGFSDLDLEMLRHGAALHDIGKIAVRQEVLHKPGRLTEDEFEHIKIHPVVGREILEPIEDFKPMLEMVYHHHERIDGRGYPEGLAGDKIPVMAQIVAVADTYDAMTSDRPYRKGMHREKALAIMAEVAGTQLNSEFVAIFARRIRALEAAQETENALPDAV